MTHGSLFAGIEGFGEGFRRAGLRTIWQVEREPFCIAVLKSRFPNVERYYDVLKCGHDRIHKLRAVDVLTAGFPCQDLSVAGKRAGLAGSRSGLFWEVVRILGELRTPWFVLENVPGLFSSNSGCDFGIVLNALDELGYGLAWRVLDSQFFGVAQRRRRVFIVGCFGKPCPEAVLFESAGGGWNSEAGGEERPDLAVPLTRGSGVSSNAPGRRREDDFNLALTHYGGELAATLPGCRRIWTDGNADNVIAASSGERAHAITGSCWKRHDEDTDTLVATALSASAGHHGHSSPRGDGSDNLVATLNSGGNDGGFRTEPGEHLVLNHAHEQRDRSQGPGNYVGAPSDSDRVRDFASLPEGLDSARYRALGNAVTANVAFWIGKRIIEAEERQVK
jgi:DNA (cytosine-5)-methyltransferase 1